MSESFSSEERDLEQIFADSPNIESASESIESIRQESERDLFLHLVTKFFDNIPDDRKMFPQASIATARLLWNECDQQGKQLLNKHVEMFRAPVWQWLIWKLESRNAASLAMRLKELGILQEPQQEFLQRNGHFAETPYGTDLFHAMLSALDRWMMCWGEDSQIPPAYDQLVKLYCKASVNLLDATQVDVGRSNSSSEYDERWDVTVTWSNGSSTTTEVPCSGDWFNLPPIESMLHDILETAGHAERFNFFHTPKCDEISSVFMDPEMLKVLSEEFALPNDFTTDQEFIYRDRFRDRLIQLLAQQADLN